MLKHSSFRRLCTHFRVCIREKLRDTGREKERERERERERGREREREREISLSLKVPSSSTQASFSS